MGGRSAAMLVAASLAAVSAVTACARGEPDEAASGGGSDGGRPATGRGGAHFDAGGPSPAYDGVAPPPSDPSADADQGSDAQVSGDDGSSAGATGGVVDAGNATCASAPAWASGVDYRTGQYVSYGGVVYECITGHTSQPTWTPPNTPALWQPTSCPDI
jgi:hypothetical protein